MALKVKNQTTVDELVLDSASSPPLTSSLHSRNSASSAQESAYLHQATILKWTQLCLSTLALAVSVAIVGCTGHVLHNYNQSHFDSDWYPSLWPLDIDLKPTLGTMIPAVIVTVASLLYIIFAITPSPHSRNLYQVLLFIATSSIAFITTLFSVAFHSSLLYNVDIDKRETLQTWTCKFYYGAKSFENDAKNIRINLNGDPLVPGGFKRMCKESMAGQWLMVTLLIVQVVCCGTAVWGYMAENRIQKSRQTRYLDQKCESELDSGNEESS